MTFARVGRIIRTERHSIVHLCATAGRNRIAPSQKAAGVCLQHFGNAAAGQGLAQAMVCLVGAMLRLKGFKVGSPFLEKTTGVFPTAELEEERIVLALQRSGDGFRAGSS